MTLNPKLKQDFDLIIDTFTGADGGTTFMAFKSVLEELDKKTDADSKQLVDFTVKFAKFLRACKHLRFPEL